MQPEPIRGTLHTALAALWEATLQRRASRGEAPPPEHLNPSRPTSKEQQ
ncbi:hypothetical protein [Glycomyces artemisiae]|uniref:Uncharacterized protein n=1 Tax=Glycomyces artemisiae TaxID=1076443 RepID=A0A2T0UF28_9ACTN|nr:hypothetical protein [Glycomyces artemisiae]PRY56474.1 hypothetical protein B0I28_109123 [Glycomyces artemisiae]